MTRQYCHIGSRTIAYLDSAPGDDTLRALAGRVERVLEATPGARYVELEGDLAKAVTTLKATPGTWAGAPNWFGYQWLANGAAIPGAIATTSTPSGLSSTQSPSANVRVNAFVAA